MKQELIDELERVKEKDLEDTFKPLIKQRKFGTIDRILRTVNIEKLSKDIMFQLLLKTYRVKERIPYRRNFLELVKDKYVKAGYELEVVKDLE